jgi:serine/threonine-protein kinase
VLDRRASSAPEKLIGQVLDGRYRIDHVIGQGGMGAVYRATHLSMGKPVALKVIRSEHASDLDAVRRFQREARAASLLDHPHTIRVFDSGESEEGLLYLVMEYLEGRTLSSVLAQTGMLPQPRAVNIAGQVAQSLAEAHGHGMVHRDLKPQNIMLIEVVGEPDFVKVLDFGIVKFLSEPKQGSSVTRTGTVIGSPDYMSPEQAQSKPPDARTDLYSLGVLLYEMLAGRRPFDSDSPMMVLMAQVNQPLPPLPEGLPVSPALRSLVHRLLAKNPEDRPPTAAHVLAELARIREETRTSTSEVGGRTGGRWWDAALPALDAGTSEYGASPGPAGSSTTPGRLRPVPPDPASRGSGPWMAWGIGVLVATGAALGLYFGLGADLDDDAGEPGVVVESPVSEDALQDVGLHSFPADPGGIDAGSPGAGEPDASSRADLGGPAAAEVSFESTPPGASVLLGDRVLGITPFRTELPVSHGPVDYTFQLSGYRTANVKALVIAGVQVSVVLDRAAKKGPRKTGRGPSGVKVIDF